MSHEKSNPLNCPEHCSKFEHCSANVCPLDPERHRRSSGRNEPVCFYLLEVAKPGSKKRFSMGHSEAMYELALKVYEEVISTACPIKKSLLRAKNTPSRMHSVSNVAAQMGATL